MVSLAEKASIVVLFPLLAWWLDILGSTEAELQVNGKASSSKLELKYPPSSRRLSSQQRLSHLTTH